MTPRLLLQVKPKLLAGAFLTTQGPVELAAVGVSISVFNLVSKVCNIPLLNVTTSFVAEDASEESSGVDDLTKFQESESTPLLSANRSQASKPRPVDISEEQKRFLPAISSALVLGIALGVGEAFILAFLAGPILNVMGVGVASPMHTPALEYLALRGLGAPAVVVALAIQGVFRGFKDTKTPLYASIAGSFVNVFLDPVLMFSLHLGVGGAAVATVVSEYFIASVLLWKLKQRVLLFPKRWEDLKFGRFLTSGGYLIGRTISLFAVFTLGTSMAARQGAIPMAAHQICVQIWLAVSLLSDSLALAGQAIIAGAFAKNDYKLVKEASIRVLQIGLGLGVVSGLALAIGMPTFTSVFTDDETVLFYVGLLIPFVVVTQPINALAFVFDGLHYGASDFEYAAVSMMAISVPSISVLLLFPNYWGISGVWAGLTTVMTLRMVAGFWRMKSTTGPWRFLNGETYETEDEL
uniref:Protein DETOXIFICATION n=1 Tax=Physcomitrium patens TaxID=3218 RepID=A0A7I4CHU9_PHYPA